MIRSFRMLAAAVLVLAMLGMSAGTAWAAPVYATDVAPKHWNSSGTGDNDRHATSEITVNDGWEQLSLSWEINWDGTNFNYAYTFSGMKAEEQNDPAISHWTLDRSPNTTENDFTNFKVFVNDEEKSTDTVEFGEDIDDIDNGAFKLDFGPEVSQGDTVTYTFESSRRPVWGHFHVKGSGPPGGGVFARNTGFNNELSEDINDFIARPDSVGIPTPAAAPMGVALFALLGAKRPRRR